MNRLRVLIAEDYPPLLRDLRTVVERAHEIAGTVADGQELLNQAFSTRPEVILLDINLPRVKGLQAGRMLKQRLPNTKLIFVTQHAAPEYIQAAFRAGARAYLLKQRVHSELLPAIDQVVNGSYYVSAQLLTTAIAECFNPANNPSELFGPGLTSLQLAILTALQKGKGEAEIAAQLGVARTTVAMETENLSSDWNAGSIQELVAYGVSAGILRL